LTEDWTLELEKEGKTMHLHDKLHICLLALESRYPENIVVLNREALGPYEFCEERWTALEVIELLEQTMPHLLEARAHLIIDGQRCEIDLPFESGEEQPVLWIFCRGRMPAHTGNIAGWRKQ
jgi:hypothetical protein